MFEKVSVEKKRVFAPDTCYLQKIIAKYIKVSENIFFSSCTSNFSKLTAIKNCMGISEEN